MTKNDDTNKDAGFVNDRGDRDVEYEYHRGDNRVPPAYAYSPHSSSRAHSWGS